MKPVLDLKTIPVEETKKASRFSPDKGIDNLVGSLCDPIILHQCSWATKDFIPEWLRNQITMDRMIELMVANNEKRDPIGTDSEALAFLMPACMEAPMGHDWTQIYLHLGTVVMNGKNKNKVMPDDIRVDKLDNMQQEDLNRLKRWIYETKLKHRAGRRTEIKKEIKEEEENAAPEVVQHAFNLD